MKKLTKVFCLGLSVVVAMPCLVHSENTIRSPVDFNPSEQIGYNFLEDTKASNGNVTPYPSCGDSAILHPGVDINKKGTTANGDKGFPIYAIANGKAISVIDNGWSRISLEHTMGNVQYYSIYGHAELDPVQCQSTVNGKGHSFTKVKLGDNIKIGQQIGCIWDNGASGSAHLHFEVRRPEHEKATNPSYFCEVAGHNSDWIKSQYTNPINFILSNGYSAGNCLVLNENFGGGILCWMNPRGVNNSACVNGTSHTNYFKSEGGVLSAAWNLSNAAIQSYCANTLQKPVNPMMFFQDAVFLAGTRGAGDAGGGSEVAGPMPVTGGTNTGTLANLIANNSDVENASKTKVTTLHINEPGFCRMQTKNIGTKDATAFQSQCWISDGDKIDTNPKDQGKEDTKGLAKGATNTEHEDFIAPEFPGKYNLVWCTDSAGPSQGQVKELKENDNCHIEDPFTVWSNANVLTTNITIIGNKTVLLPGETFSIDATLTNNEENFGKTMLIGYYNDGTLIGTDRIQRENLKGGVSKVENLSVAIAPMTPGMHTLMVCPDFDNRIAETNETDNCKSMPYEVRPLPSLVGVSIDLGGEQVIEVNETFTPGFTVRNDGGLADKLIKIGYYRDGILAGTDQVQAINLPTGKTKRETLEKFSISTPGQHTLKACVDYLGEIAESNEGDNCVEKVLTVYTIVYKPANIPLITSCAQAPDPDFNAIPTIQSGDVGAVIFGNNKQRLILPASTLVQAKISLVWGGFSSFHPSLVTRICFNSADTNWGVTASTACANTFTLQGTNWIVDIPNTPQASKGTWSFKQGDTEYWVNPSTITLLENDTDGHIRYNGWTPNTVTVSEDASGMALNTAFSSKVISGFWLPTGTVLNGKVFWNNDQDNYPGMPGQLSCDANGKLIASIANVAPGSTGRILLGLTDGTQFGWQTTNQWILPVGATIVNANGDYKLPLSASPFQKREVTYDKGQQKLTLTINGDSRMLTSFNGITNISHITKDGYFDAWIAPTGQATKLIAGTVARSSSGIWTLVFTGLPPEFGGNAYLTLTNGTKSWQSVATFAFGSGIVVDVTAGDYVMPK